MHEITLICLRIIICGYLTLRYHHPNLAKDHFACSVGIMERVQADVMNMDSSMYQ